MTSPEASVFFRKAEELLTRIAIELGLQFAKGPLYSSVTGPAHALSIAGPYERLWITLILEASGAWLDFEQVRLRWYASDAAEPLVMTRLPPKPHQTRIIRGFDDLEHDIRRMLDFLRGKTVLELEDALMDPSFARAGAYGDDPDDPNNDLPT